MTFIQGFLFILFVKYQVSASSLIYFQNTELSFGDVTEDYSYPKDFIFLNIIKWMNLHLSNNADWFETVIKTVFNSSSRMDTKLLQTQFAWGKI